jgi:hypothetical protein
MGNSNCGRNDSIFDYPDDDTHIDIREVYYPETAVTLVRSWTPLKLPLTGNLFGQVADEAHKRAFVEFGGNFFANGEIRELVAFPSFASLLGMNVSYRQRTGIERTLHIAKVTTPRPKRINRTLDLIDHEGVRFEETSGRYTAEQFFDALFRNRVLISASEPFRTHDFRAGHFLFWVLTPPDLLEHVSRVARALYEGFAAERDEIVPGSDEEFFPELVPGREALGEYLRYLDRVSFDVSGLITGSSRQSSLVRRIETIMNVEGANPYSLSVPSRLSVETLAGEFLKRAETLEENSAKFQRQGRELSRFSTER